MRSSVVCVAVVLMVAGCHRHREMSTPEFSASLATKGEWQLVALQGQAVPGGEHPLTLSFDGGERKATGFAGCNQFSTTYAIGADSIRFGPITATKMACTDNLMNQLEQKYLATLAAVKKYQVRDSSLTLTAAEGALARYRRK